MWIKIVLIGPVEAPGQIPIIVVLPEVIRPIGVAPQVTATTEVAPHHQDIGREPLHRVPRDIPAQAAAHRVVAPIEVQVAAHRAVALIEVQVAVRPEVVAATIGVPAVAPRKAVGETIGVPVAVHRKAVGEAIGVPGVHREAVVVVTGVPGVLPVVGVLAAPDLQEQGVHDNKPNSKSRI